MANVTNREEILVNSIAAIQNNTAYDPVNMPWINQVGVTRTSESYSRFEGRFSFGPNNEFWDSAVDVNGTRTYLPNELGVNLTLGTASGDKYYDISSQIFFYQPDTVVHAATAILFEPQTDVRKLWGFASWDGGTGQIKDGFILRAEGRTIQFVRISSASGSIVTHTLDRADWYDPLDGSGPSGVNLDFTKVQMAKIDFAWYGAGTARLYFRLGGKEYLAARFDGSNIRTEPITGNPNLSTIYGIENLAAVGSTPNFKHWGLSVSVDGKKEETGRRFGVGVDAVTVSGGAWVPLLSIRLKSSFSIDGADAKANTLGYLTEIVASISCSSRDARVAIIRNSVLTGASWGNIPDVTGAGIAASMVEFDTTASAFTGGIPVYIKSISSGSETKFEVYKDELISFNSLGDTTPIITIAARPLAGGNGDVSGSLSWKEVY